ncbi:MULTISPECIES: hypothetical protein [Pseudomonas]|nr:MULTISPECIES: hypothetical protein [Pseudomonas]WHS57560.1 hypothetical protein QLH64_29865 [Pseudomonas brassicacearum]WNZ87359.1 hypothetical protein QOM10_30885 [Pseudomonas sp. P108]
MKRTLLAVLSVAALVGYLTFDDARRDLAGANQSRCAAFAANDLDCPSSK